MTCVICLSEDEELTKKITLKCAHWLCAECWLSHACSDYGDSCPVCREVFKESFAEEKNDKDWKRVPLTLEEEDYKKLNKARTRRKRAREEEQDDWDDIEDDIDLRLDELLEARRQLRALIKDGRGENLRLAMIDEVDNYLALCNEAKRRRLDVDPYIVNWLKTFCAKIKSY